MLSGDEFGEGSDRHLGQGRSEGRCRARLPRTQNPRLLVIKGKALWTQDGRGYFIQYIDKFLKLKVEASIYPWWVQGFEGEDKYIDYFRES